MNENLNLYIDLYQLYTYIENIKKFLNYRNPEKLQFFHHFLKSYFALKERI